MPGQLQVKEEPQPLWGPSLAFSHEFPARQPHPALAELPLRHNPQRGHELRLTAANMASVKDVLAKIAAEHQRPGEWAQHLLTAHLAVLLTYCSQLYG